MILLFWLLYLVIIAFAKCIVFIDKFCLWYIISFIINSWLLWCSHHTISVLQSTSNGLQFMHTFTIWLMIWKEKVSNKLKDYVGIIKIHGRKLFYVSIMEKMLFLWYYVVMLMVDYAATISTMIPFTI